MTPCNFIVEDALAVAVDAAGTLQQVGHRLRPELSPADAGRWLSHCLDAGRRERLSYAQTRLVFQWAREAGDHAGFRQYAESIGYRIEPVDQQAEIASLYRRATRMAEQSKELTERALAQMQAAHINVGAIDA